MRMEDVGWLPAAVDVVMFIVSRGPCIGSVVVPRDVALIAEGRVIHLSRSLGVAEGTLKTPDDKIVAHASATCFIQRLQ